MNIDELKSKLRKDIEILKENVKREEKAFKKEKKDGRIYGYYCGLLNEAEHILELIDPDYLFERLSRM